MIFGRMPRAPRRHPLLDALNRIVGRLDLVLEQQDIIRNRVEGLSTRTRHLKEHIVADASRAEANVERILTAITDAKTRVSEDVQALRDQLANDPNDQAALNRIADRLEEGVASLGELDPDPSNPAPAPSEGDIEPTPTEPTV